MLGWFFKKKSPPAISLVRRIRDGSHWTPAGDTPYPLRGYNFVPAVLDGRTWRKDMEGERWITYSARDFDILFTRGQNRSK